MFRVCGAILGLVASTLQRLTAASGGDFGQFGLLVLLCFVNF